MKIFHTLTFTIIFLLLICVDAHSSISKKLKDELELVFSTLDVSPQEFRFYEVSKKQDLSLLKAPNTVYVIRHKYNLKGKMWSIPGNCMLVFQGGRIFNGILTGQVLNREVELDNFISNSNNITSGLTNCLAIIPDNGIVKFPKGDFTIDKRIIITKGCNLKGDNTKISIKGKEPFNMFVLNADNITIQNIYFKGIAHGFPELGFDTNAIPMYILYVRRGYEGVRIDNCIFDTASGGFFTEPLVKDVFINRCTFRNMKYIPHNIKKPAMGGAGGYGIVFNHLANPQNYGVSNGVVQNCIFESSVYRHAFYVQSSNNIKFLGNIIYGNPNNDVTKFEAAIEDRGSTNVVIEGNTQYSGIIFYNGTYNFKGDIGHDVTIKNNKMIDVTSHRDAIGVINVRSDNSIIIDNEILGVADMNAINMASSCKNVIISDNHIQMVPVHKGETSRYKTVIGSYANNELELESVYIINNTIDIDSTTQFLMYFRFAKKLSNLYIMENSLRGPNQIVFEDIRMVDGVTISDNYYEGEQIYIERNIGIITNKIVRNNSKESLRKQLN